VRHSPIIVNNKILLFIVVYNSPFKIQILLAENLNRHGWIHNHHKNKFVSFLAFSITNRHLSKVHNLVTLCFTQLKFSHFVFVYEMVLGIWGSFVEATVTLEAAVELCLEWRLASRSALLL